MFTYCITPKTFVMRLLTFLLFCSLSASAQINRSARELAKENVSTYIHEKLFKNQNYQPLTFSDLQPVERRKDSEDRWFIKHRFDIQATAAKRQKEADKSSAHSFVFFFDEKMRVVRAQQYE